MLHVGRTQPNPTNPTAWPHGTHADADALHELESQRYNNEQRLLGKHCLTDGCMALPIFIKKGGFCVECMLDQSKDERQEKVSGVRIRTIKKLAIKPATKFKSADQPLSPCTSLYSSFPSPSPPGSINAFSVNNARRGRLMSTSGSSVNTLSRRQVGPLNTTHGCVVKKYYTTHIIYI